ncbi:MAG: apolipoprotein N-acyltransferase [bacterium]|nr:apolipoprotein N-acyltransferase [bacterium]
MNDLQSATHTAYDNLNTKNEVYLVSKKYTFLRYFLLLLFGAFYALAFPVFNVSWIGWIGLIPLYLLVKNLRKSQALLGGFIWGYGWSIISFFWFGKIEPFIPYFMSAVLACFPAVWSFFIPVFNKYLLVPSNVQLEGYSAARKYLIENKKHVSKIVLCLSLAAFWSIMEWVRSWIFTGLPWNYLAITQWTNIAVIQIASFTGIYGVSFILAFVNIALAETMVACYHGYKFKIKFYRPLAVYLAILLVACNFTYGIYRITKLRSFPKKDYTILKALVVQGNLPQLRFYSRTEALEGLKVYLTNSAQMLPLKPDILIWPESAVPQPLRGGGDVSYKYREGLEKLLQKFHTEILLGTIDYSDTLNAKGDYSIYNSALLINPQGKIVNRYSKMHLVPWGEYTPMEHIFPFYYFYPWIKKTFGMGRSLTPGTKNTVFNLKKGIRASVLICFEDAFPYVSREHILRGSNMLITITNDAWFPSSSEPEQHLAQAVFRSVENNRIMVRSGNNNGTCVIQPDGAITDSIFHRKVNGKFVPAPEIEGRGAAIFKVRVLKNPSMTFYTKYGNIFIYLCWFIFALSLVFCIWRWKDKKQQLLP